MGMGVNHVVELRDQRTGSSHAAAAGSHIGVARVYDYKLESSGFAGDTSVYELSLWDIQTFTSITVNSGLTAVDGSLIEGKESAMKHISDTYSEVDIEDYSVAVNLAVTGDNGDEWVLLWDEGNIVESNGKSIIKSWMESFRFEGDKINFINMYSK